MGLKLAATWQRLAVLLAYHQRLVVENKDIRRMNKAARKIRRLTYLLDALNARNKSGDAMFVD